MAQDDLQQITFGGGAGFASASTGAEEPKTTFAWFGDIGYSPELFLNINVEGQGGTLAGISINDKNLKSFNSSFRAVTANAEIQFGEFLDYQSSDFANGIKNFYIGVGVGEMYNHITNLQIVTPYNTVNITNNLTVLPFKLGYQFNIMNIYNEPVVEFDLSYGFNYTLGKGLDGYYDNHANGNYYYTYISAGVKFAISLKNRSGKRQYRLD